MSQSAREHYADRLQTAIQAKGSPACVGLDPVLSRLPPAVIRASKAHGPAGALEQFCALVLEQVADWVPAVKINIAFFERYHHAGVAAFLRVCREAHRRGLIVIGDLKRGDIGHSAAEYAAAWLDEKNAPEEDALPDAITVNSLFGEDGIKPFAELAQQNGKGVYALIQTSNPSAAAIQGEQLESGERVSERLAAVLAKWTEDRAFRGSSGLSCIGAVVAPMESGPIERLRHILAHGPFLVPGYGAQGRGVRDVIPCFLPNGHGAIITASRSVIYAYEGAKAYQARPETWIELVREACEVFVGELKGVWP